MEGHPQPPNGRAWNDWDGKQVRGASVGREDSLEDPPPLVTAPSGLGIARRSGALLEQAGNTRQGRTGDGVGRFGEWDLNKFSSQMQQNGSEIEGK